MAVRRFGEGVLAEEAALAVIDGLRADNWYRLTAYNEKATFATFIRTLTVRLLEDFARKRFGRVRPPLWVKTFGGIWEKLFTALCLERLPVTDAVEIVLQRQMGIKKTEIENAAYSYLPEFPIVASIRDWKLPMRRKMPPMKIMSKEFRIDQLKNDKKKNCLEPFSS